MKRSTTLAAAVVIVATTFGLSACGSNEAPSKPTATGSEATDHNAADVDFATQMIPHHEQALVMVDMAARHELSPEMKQLTDDIKAAQGPEIKLMKSWLKQWGEPVPEAGGMGHMDGMRGMGSDGSDMAGMMTDDDLDDLRSRRGNDFESMWLRMMIEHHEGAIEMAEQEQEDGVFKPALTMARNIVKAQKAEIATMEEMLDS